MKVYVWRHNKTYHSHSMINEPCVQNHFYLDALAIVAAESLEEALKTYPGIPMEKLCAECRLADRRPACAYSQGI